jgi:hypothetical protein
MRYALKLAVAIFPLWAALIAPGARAQTYDDLGDRVLLSAEQGQAVAELAEHLGPGVRPKPDCSHLVHLLYAQAGLIYSYQDSRVLYRGISDFERVKTPQPGDLVVWLGHVGIVLSPEEHTFLSSVRSGIITESWIASHWSARGRPHFFRYRIGPDTNKVLLSAVMNDNGIATDNGRAQIQGRDEVSNGSTAHIPFPGAERQAATDREPAEPATRAGRNAPAPWAELGRATTDEAGVDSRSIVALVRQREKPDKHQIAAALLESSSARAQRLISGQILDLNHALSVFERLEVVKVRIRHESGSVTLKLSEIMSQEAGRVFPANTVERELSVYRRRDGVWVISDPRDRTYLPQGLALSVFERQAEIFLQRAPNSTSTRTVVKVLDRLYDQQPHTTQRAAVK